ncbi:MAG: phosphotransferase [Bacteroidales bacterium]|nr:phosphotransferase [Bacteroidales bacterium]
MQILTQLFENYFGEPLKNIEPIPGSGSNRLYVRLIGEKNRCIGMKGESVVENEAFIYLANHFFSKGLTVPQLFAISEDRMSYIQQDCGDVPLFDFVASSRDDNQYSEAQKKMLVKTLESLADFQVKGAEEMDYSVCFPRPEFDRRCIFWDLNYFKYCFLRPYGVAFSENLMEDEFERMADLLDAEVNDVFLYRDFQSRNVMVSDETPYFIDFQGGRRGQVYYDVASFLWQVEANYSPEMKDLLIDAYITSLRKYRTVDEVAFRKRLVHFALFRLLQVLGACGFRGLIEKKQYFIDTIPAAIRNIHSLLDESDFDEYPYLVEVLRGISYKS